MRTAIKRTDVYTFGELSNEAQDKAINDHINFWLEMRPYEDEYEGSNFKAAIDKAEAMQTPWFAASYVLDYCEDEIMNEIDANEYEYDEDGNIY